MFSFCHYNLLYYSILKGKTKEGVVNPFQHKLNELYGDFLDPKLAANDKQKTNLKIAKLLELTNEQTVDSKMWGAEEKYIDLQLGERTKFIEWVYMV